MPSEDRYEDSAFGYFAIAILSFFLLFWTYRYLKVWHKAFFGKYQGICGCPECIAKAKRLQLESRKPSRWGVIKFMIFAGLWVVFIALVIYASQTGTSQGPAFDPYEILEISRGATDAEIKKAYRSLSLRFHPDKNKEPGANERYISISKAYDTLTDPAAKEKWEKYGNPDGPQAVVMGVALPSFLVAQDKMYVVLAIYVAFLVIVFPTAAICYWQKQKSLHTNELSKQTMYFFYREMKEMMRFKKVMEMISLACTLNAPMQVRRADEDCLKKLKPLLPVKEEREVNRNKKKTPNPFVTKHVMLLETQISRLNHELTEPLREDLQRILLQFPRLMLGILEIAAGHRWLVPTMESLQTIQMVIQGVWSEIARNGRNTQLYQIPYFNEQMSRMANHKKYKVTTVPQLLNLPISDQKEVLVGLSESQFSYVQQVCHQMMPLDVDWKVNCIVDEDDENYGITAGSIVTLKAEFTRPSQPSNLKDGKEQPVEVHCPFFPFPKDEVWWLIIAHEPNEMMGIKRIDALRDKLEVKVPFPAPRKPGVYSYSVFLICDSYVGFDKKTQIKINVQKEVDWQKEKERYKLEPEMEGFYSDEESDEEENEKKSSPQHSSGEESESESDSDQ
eukprot:TRINITY_DN1766_c0_g2_i1.p1 TRINITY_DN1766_c0_g2~~TRINITY_DN1766_c0_g2_i1.p1  ORF type:complete len:619 (-),score=162.34 TRINITY_DN1766_c0_g2_i1:117-1973(-)